MESIFVVFSPGHLANTSAGGTGYCWCGSAFSLFFACVMVAAMLAALCSPRRSFQLVLEMVGLAAILAATFAATAVCCDLWRPCPCLSGLAPRWRCPGIVAMMAATCRDWWRPCPRGSATPCFGSWRGSLRLPTRCPRLLCWGGGMRENIRLLTMFEVASLALGYAEFGWGK